ncbi:MAG: hypothetical protein IT373_26775 [Polyangiaceae bacterium]|nr:hypothetical protein [Polyangiaceae bacterium]
MKTTLATALLIAPCLLAVACSTSVAQPAAAPTAPEPSVAAPVSAADELEARAAAQALREAARACDAGQAARCAEAGQVWLRGGAGLESNDLVALQTFERGCTFGDGKSCLEAALLHRARSEGGDEPRYLDFLNRACAHDLAVACTTLGFELGEHGGIERALRSFERACELGDQVGCKQAAATRALLGPEATNAEVAPLASEPAAETALLD